MPSDDLLTNLMQIVDDIDCLNEHRAAWESNSIDKIIAALPVKPKVEPSAFIGSPGDLDYDGFSREGEDERHQVHVSASECRPMPGQSFAQPESRLHPNIRSADGNGPPNTQLTCQTVPSSFGSTSPEASSTESPQKGDRRIGLDTPPPSRENTPEDQPKHQLNQNRRIPGADQNSKQLKPPSQNAHSQNQTSDVGRGQQQPYQIVPYYPRPPPLKQHGPPPYDVSHRSRRTYHQQVPPQRLPQVPPQVPPQRLPQAQHPQMGQQFFHRDPTGQQIFFGAFKGSYYPGQSVYPGQPMRPVGQSFQSMRPTGSASDTLTQYQQMFLMQQTMQQRQQQMWQMNPGWHGQMQYCQSNGNGSSNTQFNGQTYCGRDVVNNHKRV